MHACMHVSFFVPRRCSCSRGEGLVGLLRFTDSQTNANAFVLSFLPRQLFVRPDSLCRRLGVVSGVVLGTCCEASSSPALS